MEATIRERIEAMLQGADFGGSTRGSMGENVTLGQALLVWWGEVGQFIVNFSPLFMLVQNQMVDDKLPAVSQSELMKFLGFGRGKIPQDRPDRYACWMEDFVAPVWEWQWQEILGLMQAANFLSEREADFLQQAVKLCALQNRLWIERYKRTACLRDRLEDSHVCELDHSMMNRGPGPYYNYTVPVWSEELGTVESYQSWGEAWPELIVEIKDTLFCMQLLFDSGKVPSYLRSLQEAYLFKLARPGNIHGHLHQMWQTANVAMVIDCGDFRVTHGWKADQFGVMPEIRIDYVDPMPLGVDARQLLRERRRALQKLAKEKAWPFQDGMSGCFDQCWIEFVVKLFHGGASMSHLADGAYPEDLFFADPLREESASVFLIDVGGAQLKFERWCEDLQKCFLDAPEVTQHLVESLKPEAYLLITAAHAIAHQWVSQAVSQEDVDFDWFTSSRVVTAALSLLINAALSQKMTEVVAVVQVARMIRENTAARMADSNFGSSHAVLSSAFGQSGFTVEHGKFGLYLQLLFGWADDNPPQWFVRLAQVVTELLDTFHHDFSMVKLEAAVEEYTDGKFVQATIDANAAWLNPSQQD